MNRTNPFLTFIGLGISGAMVGGAFAGIPGAIIGTGVGIALGIANEGPRARQERQEEDQAWLEHHVSRLEPEILDEAVKRKRKFDEL